MLLPTGMLVKKMSLQERSEVAQYGYDSDRPGRPSPSLPQVYLHKELEARSMILPSTGEVILGEGASVTFVDTAAPGDDRCRGAGEVL